MDVWWQNIEKNIGCSETKFGQWFPKNTNDIIVHVFSIAFYKTGNHNRHNVLWKILYTAVSKNLTKLRSGHIEKRKIWKNISAISLLQNHNHTFYRHSLSYSTTCLSCWTQRLHKSARISKNVKDRAGHHNPYNGTVQGHNMATITILSDKRSCLLDSRIYTVSIRVGEIYTLS
jgi:hypothetical protein